MMEEHATSNGAEALAAVVQCCCQRAGKLAGVRRWPSEESRGLEDGGSSNSSGSAAATATAIEKDGAGGSRATSTGERLMEALPKMQRVVQRMPGSSCCSPVPLGTSLELRCAASLQLE